MAALSLTHSHTHTHSHSHFMYLSPLSRECTSECAKERGRRYNNNKRSEREGTRGRRRRRLSRSIDRSLVSHSRKARDIAATMSKFKLTPTRMIGPYVRTRSLTHPIKRSRSSDSHTRSLSRTAIGRSDRSRLLRHGAQGHQRRDRRLCGSCDRRESPPCHSADLRTYICVFVCS